MQADSRPVSSNQSGVNPELPATVNKHRCTTWRKPHAEHNLQAFSCLSEWLSGNQQPLILDSFCGTGMSTQALAKAWPTHRVIGIDKSIHRLERHATSEQTGNYLLLQAECEPLWQLMSEHSMCIDRHYLLYPNPWPKSRHLKRRIHGHPGLIPLYQLGGTIELRSNWQLYVEEFGLALHLLGCRGTISQLSVGNALTLFEAKYAKSGHTLWRFKGQIPKQPI
ncbi:MAG: SAM-dependent methyltransferase [Halioglobus sp.]